MTSVQPLAPRGTTNRRSAIPTIDATAADIVEISNNVEPKRVYGQYIRKYAPYFVW